ncbi:MAG: helicase-related protein [Phycisphaerales bacterium]
MASLESIIQGSTVQGLVPHEPVTIVSVQWHGTSVLQATFRLASGRVEESMLYRTDEPRLIVSSNSRPWAFDSPGDMFRLVSEAHRINLAALFDPLLAVHTSLVQPLPHQIVAVYERMLREQPLRFLLADDPGAGKTIMAGLLIKELIARADLERCLIVAPGSLVEQWQDELSQKFQLSFEIATNDNLEAARSGNWFLENPLAIARLDKLSRNEDIQRKLSLTQWDLVVVDEAHKMSATFFGGEAQYTKRYRLGQFLSGLCRHFLLMTATPHNGKESDFQLFMALLDGDRFEGQQRDTTHTIDSSDMMRRLVKEQLLKFDGSPLFPERRASTAAYKLSQPEAQLYKDVTEYVREEFNRAEQFENDGRKGTVGFALTVLQRRLASSPEAIYQSLRRRRERLESYLREARLLQRGGKSSLLEELKARTTSAEDIQDLEAGDETPGEETEIAEEQIASDATAARTLDELQIEIDILRRLESQAHTVRRSGVDRKWEELSKILQDTPEMFDPNGHRRKLIIFTEHRDTLSYLKERIATLLGRQDAIVTIQGGMGRDQRRAAEESFKQDKDVQILLATDAAGEGINLQRAHLMVNYDLPWNPNRIEQRFGRIHRIGQTEVCHLWNMVAAETREGDVYYKLLEKLEAQRAALGGRVFDVLGRLFDMQNSQNGDGEEKAPSLRSLMIEAIRYGDQPEVRAKLLETIENATEQKHLRDLLEHDSLARDSLDVRKVQAIREDMERAEALRLQPHYIQAFFMEAFKRLGGQISQREQGRFEVTRVPGLLRERDRQIGSGPPVLTRYERVTFEKELINQQGKPIAAFICPGHPLLDAVLDVVLEQNRAMLRRGALLIDPSDRTETPRVLFYLEHNIRDAIRSSAGEPRLVSREVEFVEIEESGRSVSPGYAPYLDYRPATSEETTALANELLKPWLVQGIEHRALTYAVEKLVPEHLARVRKGREERIEKTTDAVRQRLTKEIAYWDHRAQELLAREQAGKTPKINSTMARQRADDLEGRLQRRLALLDQERHLSPSPPLVVGGALVVPARMLNAVLGNPGPSTPAVVDRDRIDKLAIEAVVATERALGRSPRVMDHSNPGYDIESADPREPGRLRFLEVKGKAVGRETVTVSATQIRCCLNQPDNWILAVVPVDGEYAKVPRYIRRPFTTPPDFAEVSKNLDLAALLERGEEPS